MKVSKDFCRMLPQKTNAFNVCIHGRLLVVFPDMKLTNSRSYSEPTANYSAYNDGMYTSNSEVYAIYIFLHFSFFFSLNSEHPTDMLCQS